MVMVITLASALAYALASVLQHHEASDLSPDHSMKPKLLLGLATSPIWLLGILADIVGFVLQFIALGHASLLFVQPLLVTGLLFALPLGALLAKRRVSVRELFGALLVIVGLTSFELAASPGPGRSSASALAWYVTVSIVVVSTGGLMLLSRRLKSPRRKAQTLALASGIAYGLGAALMQVTSRTISTRSVGAVLTTWYPYALVVFGALTLLLVQSSFQAGSLSDTLPILTVVDPLASILIGALTLGEGIDKGVAESLIEVISLMIMAVGIEVVTSWQIKTPGRNLQRESG